MIETNGPDTRFAAINIAALRAGQLVDRSLYIYLSVNRRYVEVAKPLLPLEQRAISIFEKSGAAFATEAAIEERLPELSGAAAAVKLTCDDDALAPFEKHRAIVDATRWLVPHIVGKRQAKLEGEPSVFSAGQALDYDPTPAVFFFHRAFGVPRPETLLYVSDLSLEMYERSLKLAAVSAVFAMWLGYTEARFVTQFALTVFCEDVGIWLDEKGPTIDPNSTDAMLLRGKSAGLLANYKIPGTDRPDWRFRDRVGANPAEIWSGALGDELYEVVEFARRLMGDAAVPEAILDARVSRKLQRELGFDFGNKPETAPAEGVAA